MKKFKRLIFVVVGLLILSSFLVGCSESKGLKENSDLESSEREYQLPDIINFATREVGTSVHASTVALSPSLEKELGSKIRILPLTQTEQIELSKSNKIDIFMTGGAIFNDVLGLGNTAKQGLGPQSDLRLIWAGVPTYSGACAVATESSGIKLPADVKGKKVGWAAADTNMCNAIKGYLAFANLTVEDVTLVKFSDAADVYEAGIQGKIDFWSGNHSGPKFYEAEASKNGLYIIPYDLEDKEGWSRFLEYNPNYFPGYVTSGAGFSGRDKVESAMYSLPTVLVREGVVDDQLVYCICEGMYNVVDKVAEGYDPVLAMKVESMLQPGAVINAPFHPAAIEFFKDKGLWTSELEEANLGKLKQVNEAKKLWDSFIEDFKAKEKDGQKADIEDEWKETFKREVGF